MTEKRRDQSVHNKASKQLNEMEVHGPFLRPFLSQQGALPILKLKQMNSKKYNRVNELFLKVQPQSALKHEREELERGLC